SIVGRQRTADDFLAEPRILAAYALAAHHLQLEAEVRSVGGVALQLDEIRIGSRELDVPGRDELAVGTDELAQPSPDLARSARQGQFGEMPALLPHAAEIDTARLRSQRTFFHEANAQAVPAQVKRRRAAGDAAADDRDIDA